MPQPLKIILFTALWYGAASELLIYVVAPWLHTGVGYVLHDGVTLPTYQKRAVISAAIGYPLLCAALIFLAAYRRNNAGATAPATR